MPSSTYKGGPHFCLNKISVAILLLLLQFPVHLSIELLHEKSNATIAVIQGSLSGGHNLWSIALSLASEWL